jgi:hypothetical protein
MWVFCPVEPVEDNHLDKPTTPADAGLRRDLKDRAQSAIRAVPTKLNLPRLVKLTLTGHYTQNPG